MARTLTIRRRLVISGLLLVVLFGLNLGVALWSAARRDHALADLHRTLARRALLDALDRDLVARARDASVTRHLRLDAEQAEALQTRLRGLEPTVTALEALTPPDRSRTITPLLTECAALQALWAREVEASRRGEAIEEAHVAPERLQLVLDALRRASAAEQARADEVIGVLRRVSQLGTQLGTALFLLSLGTACAASWWLWARVARAPQTLIHGSRRVGRGDLAHRIALTSRDELGEVAEAFNAMSASLSVSMGAALEARAEAERANRAKSTFLASMTHELRTPMTAVLGYLEIAREGAREAGLTQIVEDLTEIDRASHHMLTLVNELLDLARIESGRMTLHVEMFDVPALVDDVVRVVRPLVERQHNRLCVDAGSAPTHMVSDPTKIRQTLLNLIGNAAKFTDDGTIALSVACGPDDPETVRFTVRDTGVGIPADCLGRIFDEFDQGDPSVARAYGGTGLGLAIARRFCRMMGGDIDVTSVPGCGTAFTVDLPRTVDAAACSLVVVEGGAGAASAPSSPEAATA